MVVSQTLADETHAAPPGIGSWQLRSSIARCDQVSAGDGEEEKETEEEVKEDAEATQKI